MIEEKFDCVSAVLAAAVVAAAVVVAIKLCYSL